MQIKPIFFALLLFSPIAHAQLYKWRTPDGKLIYSDLPPPVGTKAEGLDIRNEPPSNSIQTAQTELQRLKEKGNELEKQRKLKEAIAQKEQKEQTDKALAKQRCNNAQKRKAEVLNAGGDRIFNGKQFVFRADRVSQIEQATIAAEIACRP